MNRINYRRLDADNFGRYGSVARLPGGPPLAADETFEYWSDAGRFEVGGETEIGYCTVKRRSAPIVDWMEQHVRTPEVLIPIDNSFVLPVMSEDGAVEAFAAEPGEAVVIGTGVWHSACLPLGGDKATYFVIFRRRTPQEDVTKKNIAPVFLQDV